ncbi:hypothetical protein JCM8547_009243 [Rhodosporidiobolus lusitaniae]
MIDRLPTELLSHIVGLGAPLDYTPSFYLERRQLLRDVCLVSKRMRDVAQPMLAEVYVVKTKTDVERLEEVDEQGKLTASKIKVLVLERKSTWDAVAGFEIRRELFVACTGVTELRPVHTGDIDLDWLAPLSPSPPHKPGPDFPSTSFDDDFPHLLELSVNHNGDDVDPPLFASSPSFVTTPSLRAFGLTANGGDAAVLSPYLERSASFLRRLDVFNLDMADECISPALTEEVVSGIRRLLGYAGDAGSSSLRILILPRYFRTALLDVPEFDLLQAACAQREVELVWKEQVNWACESLISPWFWRRARRIKQEEAAKQQEGQAE